MRDLPGRIEIIGLRIEDENGRPVRKLSSLVRYWLVITVNAQGPRADIHFGFLVRDPRGFEVLRWDTGTAGMATLPPFAAGETRDIRVAFDANLGPGVLFWTAAAGHADEIEAAMRLAEPFEISVEAPTLHTSSLTNLNVKLEPPGHATGATVLDARSASPATGTDREMRYGRRRMEIVAFHIEDESGRPVRKLSSLGRYRLVTSVTTQDPMDDIHFGFLVRDPRGFEVFGWDTWTAGMGPLPPFAAGETRDISAAFDVNLGPGTFFMTFALAHSDQEKEDLRFDAFEFSVAARDLHPNSITNLNVN
jgi:hypothetical protein